MTSFAKGAAVALFASTIGISFAQSGAQGRGAVVGTGVFTSFVENMDRSLAFYRDAFGMDVPAVPASGERPYNQPNPQLFAMFRSRARRNGISRRACPERG
jgi:hypothetical protein